MVIAKDSVVAFDYVLTDDKGEVLDTSEGKEPLRYMHGHGQLVRGVENGLAGKTSGESVVLVIPPRDAYGEYDEKLLLSVPKSKIEGDEEIAIGSPIVVRMKGAEHMFNIVRMDGNDVVLDGNHPLAGLTLHFDITIREVRAALPEELEHGHAHTHDDCGGCCGDDEEGHSGGCGSGCGGCG